ncbi:histone deacetylase family protein [Telmatospirillum siberiense]|uniref:Acetoin utilization protein n=1 Tax=Telmatospirillum siberiense TaxID=382514 RepID=A0A2N3PYP1_9PROT|nr:histone deacetylase family protein [Telmatospirillum siberiense]PKU25532.1 acetoin utilization protein [Telmatospirillum siberiense]
MTTLLLTHPACLQHETGDYHPECADRLRAVNHILEHEDFLFLAREEAPRATTQQLLRAHSMDHIDHILSLVPAAGEILPIDDDTFVSSHSSEAALRAAGAICAAVEEVAAKRCRNAFCAVRPPGHHAERSAAMGFCLFSNAAIGALHARDACGFRKVAVIDFDVHHGNGTQQILWDEAGMFYASTHQQDAYPYSGTPDEQGQPGGGVIVNIPLPAGSGSDAFRLAYGDIILPRLRAFAPEFVIVSAGFDAHAADPMADLRLQVADFEWVTRELLRIAEDFCGARLVSVLEGGYDTRALAACVASHVRALMEG